MSLSPEGSPVPDTNARRNSREPDPGQTDTIPQPKRKRTQDTQLPALKNGPAAKKTRLRDGSKSQEPPTLPQPNPNPAPAPRAKPSSDPPTAIRNWLQKYLRVLERRRTTLIELAKDKTLTQAQLDEILPPLASYVPPSTTATTSATTGLATRGNKSSLNHLTLEALDTYDTQLELASHYQQLSSVMGMSQVYERFHGSPDLYARLSEKFVREACRVQTLAFYSVIGERVSVLGNKTTLHRKDLLQRSDMLDCIFKLTQFEGYTLDSEILRDATKMLSAETEAWIAKKVAASADLGGQKTWRYTAEDVMGYFSAPPPIDWKRLTAAAQAGMGVSDSDRYRDGDGDGDEGVDGDEGEDGG